MNRSAHKLVIFSGETGPQRFVGLLRAMCGSSGVKALAYCVMSNHYHMLVQGTGAQLTRCFHEVDRIWALSFNEPRKGKGHVFQGPFLSFPQRSQGWILRTSIYIHLNPAGHVGLRPEDYAWSSCRQYLGNGGGPSWVAAGDVLGLLGRDERAARSMYLRMMNERMEGTGDSLEMADRDRLEVVMAGELVRWVPVVANEVGIPEQGSRNMVCHYGRHSLRLSVAALAHAFGCPSARIMSMRLARVGRRLASESGYVHLVSKAAAILDGISSAL